MARFGDATRRNERVDILVDGAHAGTGRMDAPWGRRADGTRHAIVVTDTMALFEAAASGDAFTTHGSRSDMPRPAHGDLGKLVTRAARAAKDDPVDPKPARGADDAEGGRGRPDRRRRKGIVVYVERGTHRRLRQIGLDREQTLQDLMSEAVDRFLAAPEGRGATSDRVGAGARARR